MSMQEQEQEQEQEQARGAGALVNLCVSKPEFTSVFHVGVLLPNTSVSPLSLRERVRVRALC